MTSITELVVKLLEYELDAPLRYKLQVTALQPKVSVIVKLNLYLSLMTIEGNEVPIVSVGTAQP
jgi:hypothetical protein